MKISIRLSFVNRTQVFVVMLTLLLAAGNSFGQTLNVNVQYDSASSSPATNVTSSTTVGGFTTLRSAIQYANFHSGTTINVPAGTYKLTLLGVKEDSAATGDLDINSSMTIRGNGTATTFIDGNGTDRVFSMNPKLGSTPPTVKITQLTIKNGATNSETIQEGGGIQIQNANVTLDTVAVDSNTAATSGGGINISNDGGTLVMNSGKIQNNSCTSYGGAVQNSAGTITLNSVIISRNQTGSQGGGINIDAGSMTISNALIDSNVVTAGSGGGLNMAANVTITGTTFKRNVALGSANQGGAILRYNGNLIIKNSSIDSNSTQGSGGGLCRTNSTSTFDSLINVTVNYNKADTTGGGIQDEVGGLYWSGGSLAHNSAGKNGGGVFWMGSSKDQITSVDTTGNSPNLTNDFVNVVFTTPLPVELTSLLATTNEGVVMITWQTVTEVDNVGFNVLRKTRDEASFTQIASFTTNSSLRGAGTSNSPKKYSFVDNNVASGITYSYKVQSVATTGAVKDWNAIAVTVGVPKVYALYQNFPNPFNPSTTVRFDLKQPSNVNLEVYNILGQLMISENRGMMSAGSYSQEFDMSRFASGVYFYRIAAAGANGEKFVALKRMMLIK